VLRCLQLAAPKTKRKKNTACLLMHHKKKLTYFAWRKSMILTGVFHFYLRESFLFFFHN